MKKIFLLIIISSITSFAQITQVEVKKQKELTMGNNPEQALKNYMNALSLGGTKTLPELYKAAGLEFNLTPAYIKTLMEFVQTQMDEL